MFGEDIDCCICGERRGLSPLCAEANSAALCIHVTIIRHNHVIVVEDVKGQLEHGLFCGMYEQSKFYIPNSREENVSAVLDEPTLVGGAPKLSNGSA